MSIVNGQVKSFVERIERMNEEIKAANEDKSEIFKELKAQGYCPKAIKSVIKDRAKNPSDLSEEQELYDLYWRSSGSGLAQAREEAAE